MGSLHNEDDNQYELKNVPLIPLVDGTWRCPPSIQEPIYFPASQGIMIPPGLDLSLVDAEACACPQKKELFRLLGVKDCDVSNVVERILDYHSNRNSAAPVTLIAQVKYLYRAREYLQHGDMMNVLFPTTNRKNTCIKGSSLYIDTSTSGELKQLFSRYREAYFADPRLFEGLDTLEKSSFVTWIETSANAASMPRIRSLSSDSLHADFAWLLKNRPERILDILEDNWTIYHSCLTPQIVDVLSTTSFECRSGARIALRETYLPSPSLLERSEVYCDPKKCHFLEVPTETPSAWKFLRDLDVGVEEDLSFYLWLLKQPGYEENAEISKVKQLYIAIQSHGYDPAEEERIR